jgi:hypothetical protein
VDSPTAGQNIGYADRNQHAYWHYKDIDFSPDGTPLPPSVPVDLVTQIKLMIAALPAFSGASDDVRSYDLVWLLHLVGDAHQPLHAVGRFTKQIPNGDAGGNVELVMSIDPEARAKLVIIHPRKIVPRINVPCPTKEELLECSACART